MSPHIPSTSGVDPVDTETGQEPLVSAAVRIARELPAARPVVGVLRGWGRADREQARALRWHLAQQEIRSTELSAVPEAGERHHVSPAGQRPIVHFLLHVGGSQRVQALRAAALWNLPLLAERPPGASPSGLTGFHARRLAVIGVHLPGETLDIAVRQATITCLQPHAGNASLLLDNEKISAPADRPLCIDLTAEGVLQVRGETFATRHVRRLRYERPWSAYRLDIDGIPAHDVRAPLRFEPMPGRLHLFHP
ncbi:MULTISPECIES: hypothetical protein [Streptomyces]|uniref:Uncharacterized protein n=1 Tax=Streptomyces cavourensis TaxID=67258 RepID=A0ABY5FAS3_9ACTN|nr:MULTISPECIES: hypothetical protein [Streptomyces]UTR80775.1 hypothetical protein NLU04_20985 [Streptomyces cavourensis]WST13555.1 hypothetical protein OG721_06040 [Streptomyces microflavus]SCK25980.1 hypothetical protein YUYDRAFT_02829 [Streptomyces sp. ScaeMP-e48]